VKLKEAFELRKSKILPIGTIKKWGGKKYQKTSQGWIPYSEKQQITKKRLKRFHKEMRSKYGGGWVGEVLLRGKMKLVELLINQGKARKQRADGHFKISFAKSNEDREN